MINPFEQVNWNPDDTECRNFAKSILIGFPAIAVLFLLAGRVLSSAWNVELALAVGGIGFCVGLTCWFVPAIAKPLYAVWYSLACFVGMIVGNGLLIIFFLTMVTGLGLVVRVLGRLSVLRSMDRRAETYWQNAEQPSDLRSYYRQF